MSDDLYLSRHFCIVVPSIDTAIEDLGRLVGLEFKPVARMRFTMRRGDVEVIELLHVSFSIDGLIELVERTAEGAFGRDSGPGLHHIGLVTTRAAEARAEQQDSGYEADWRLFNDAGREIATFYRSGDPGRVPVEIVDVSGRGTDWNDRVAASEKLEA